MIVGSSLSLAGVRKKLLTGAGQCHESRICVIASIFGTAAFDSIDVADLQGILVPTRAHQSIGATQLDPPVAGLAGIILHIHVKPGMRVLPFYFCNRARKICRFTGIELVMAASHAFIEAGPAEMKSKLRLRSK